MKKETYSYPQEANNANFEQLRERAIKIIKDNEWLPLLALASGIIFYLIVVVVVFAIFVLRAFNSLPRTEMVSYGLLGLYLVSIIVALIFTFWFLERWQAILVHALNKRFHSYEEAVFAECFVMANFLLKNNRKGAVRRARYFVDYLSYFKNDFISNFIFFEPNKCYETEFKMLIDGESVFRRMLLFSKADVPNMLVRFGLALVNKNDPVACFWVNELITEAEKYGKLESKYRKLFSSILRIAADIAASRI
jgi:hypothetical protein